MNIQLSILEFGLINPPQLHAYQTLNSMMEEIGHIEEAGYKRLWLTEHYSPEFAWFNPEMLLPLLAGYTQTIKVGMAGVLLNYHSPLRVLQNFQILSALFPGRIDLGLARAGMPAEIGVALTDYEGPTRTDWNGKINQLFKHYHHDFAPEEAFSNLPLPPHGTAKPDVWFLGVSGSSIPEAVNRQSNFAISMVHPFSDPAKNIDTLRRFKDEYATAHGRLPEAALCIRAKCRAYGPNRRGELLDLEGEAAFVADQIRSIAEEYDTSEIVIVDDTLDRQERFENLLRLIETINQGTHEKAELSLSQ